MTSSYCHLRHAYRHAITMRCRSTRAPLTRLRPCFSTKTIIMLSSSCDLDKHIVVLHHHLVNQVYPSQTKILERWTKDEIRIFEALFKGVSTRFGLRTTQKSVENPDFIFCSFFQNLRLGCDHAIIIMWVRPTHGHCSGLTHRHAINAYHPHVISTDTFTVTHLHAIIILWVRQTHGHCYHHLVLSTDTSLSCEFENWIEMHIGILSQWDVD